MEMVRVGVWKRWRKEKGMRKGGGWGNVRGSICTYLVGDGGIDKDRGEDGARKERKREMSGW